MQRIKHQFFLSGINNQNFLMQDRQTGSWWQQVSGAAIAGPLKGQKLKAVYHDELTFGVWKKEQPNGRVLKPDPRVLRADRYASKGWEERISRLPVVGTKKGPLAPRELIVGIQIGKTSKAYPIEHFKSGMPVNDAIEGTSVVILADTAAKSIRAFKAIKDGKRLTFYRDTRAPLRFVDETTATVWDFTGRALEGPLQGTTLEKIPVLKDFWFDWKNYHPDTLLYKQPLT